MLSTIVVATPLAYSQTTQILFQDNFNRPNSSTLGAPWTELNELPSQFIEINNLAAAFHYVVPPGDISKRPYMEAPLSHAISSFPASFSFTFTPPQSPGERIAHLIGLGSSSAGLLQFFDGVGTVTVPKTSFSLFLAGSQGGCCAAIFVTKGENGTGTELARKFTSFQFDPGVTYSVKATIQSDFSAAFEITNGTTTDTFSSPATTFSSQLDEFFISDGQEQPIGAPAGDYFLRFDDILVTQTNPVPSVQIDIKPGSFPNSINLGSNGTVPVAVFSTSTFDATTIDPLTVTLAGAQVQLKGKGTPNYSFSDVNGDGLLDILLHVNTEALQMSETDTEAVLEGTTFGGTKVSGKDSVRIVP